MVNEQLNAALAEIRRLRTAIEEHRAQKADDRCIEDDDRLYAALGDGIQCDRRVGDKAQMLANCARFIERRCEGGHWLSYVELEALNNELLDAIEKHMSDCFGCALDIRAQGDNTILGIADGDVLPCEQLSEDGKLS